MRTEEQIVYELLNTYHGGELSADNVVNERLMRTYLRKHRASNIEKYFNEGMSLSEEVFQSLGTVTLVKETNGDFSTTIPPMILTNNHGIRIYKNDYDIPFMDKEAFRYSKRNMINRAWPKATGTANTLVIFIGYKDLCNAEATSVKEQAVFAFSEEASKFDIDEEITVEIEAVLYDPSQAPGYDWTRDPYPCPSGIVDMITTSTLSRDLGIMIRQPQDQNHNNLDEKGNPYAGI